jgi:phage gp29-like protein
MVVQGETLTTEVGGVGSYAIGNVHADTKHAIVIGDARKLARTLRSDLFYPLVEINEDVLCGLFHCTPDDLKAAIPTISWRIDRETNPTDRATIISMAINEWGMEVDEEQQRDEFAINAPRPGTKPLKGKPQVISDGAQAVGSLDASDGVDNPKEQESNSNG